MIYTGDDAHERWESLEDHYTPTDIERIYARQMPGWLVPDFQLYCIGYKLSHRLEGMHGDATSQSFERNDGTRERRIRRALQYPDPRLKRENFSDSRILTTEPDYTAVVVGYGDNQHLRRRFLTFIWGSKIMYPERTPGKATF